MKTLNTENNINQLKQNTMEIIIAKIKEIRKQLPRTKLVLEFNEDKTKAKIGKVHKSSYLKLNQMTVDDFIEGEGYIYYPNLSSLEIV